MSQAATTYQQEAKRYQQQLDQIKHQQGRISLARLVLMIALLVGGYQFFAQDHYAWLALALVGLAGFVWLVRLFFGNLSKIRLLERLVAINEHELDYVQNGELSHFADGEKYINPDHPYTFDLDIFGPGSLFQHINRTSTPVGEERLSGSFQEQDNTQIEARQVAIQELSKALEWRQDFTARGRLFPTEELSVADFKTWLIAPPVYLKKWLLRGISFLFPLITIGLLIGTLAVSGTVMTSFLTIFILLNLAIMGYHSAQFKKEALALDGITKLLNTYGQLLQAIEKSDFQTPLLQALREGIFTEGKSASEAISSLSSILKKLESQSNPFVSIIANGFWMDAMHTIIALERWKAQYGKQVPDWIDIIAEYDALNSLANLYYNNPDFQFPQLATEPVLRFEEAGHPLIPEKKRITNSLDFDAQRFIILTGSNMSGKSTFLRTLGVNLLFARMGLPVCAASATVYPMDIFVSMKINDSLQNEESLFYAELKRLHRIVDRVKQGQQTFVILDEILRGTNSNDKSTGTRSLIEQLAAHKVYGIIATHDLSISEMVNQHPAYLHNKCFEVAIEGDNISFDYLLKDGVCQKMSAVFLMKQMEIIP